MCAITKQIAACVCILKISCNFGAMLFFSSVIERKFNFRKCVLQVYDYILNVIFILQV